MTDDTPDSIRHLTTPERTRHETEIGGLTMTLTVGQPTLNDLQAIDEDAEDELDAMRAVADEYLHAVDGHSLAIGDVPLPKLRQLYEAMQAAWADDDMVAAREEMPVEGNR